MPKAVPTVDPTNAVSTGTLRLAIAQASELAARVELGQGQMPLRDHFEALSKSIDYSPLSLTLVGLDTETRAAALRWLCGQQLCVLTKVISGLAGLVEVQLVERGYVLVASGRRWSSTGLILISKRFVRRICSDKGIPRPGWRRYTWKYPDPVACRG